MELPVIYVWTHDSIGLGEDGPTHQPIEHLAALRAMPRMRVIRPADATETAEAWRLALERTDGPVGIALSRQKLPVLDRTRARARERRPARRLRPGRHARRPRRDPDRLGVGGARSPGRARDAERRGSRARASSRCPTGISSWRSRRATATRCCRGSVWRRVSLEAGATFGWPALVGDRGTAIGLDRYGASAPAPTIARELGITPDAVVAAARALCSGSKRESDSHFVGCSEGCSSLGPAGSGEIREREARRHPISTEERDAENQIAGDRGPSPRSSRCRAPRRTSGTGKRLEGRRQRARQPARPRHRQERRHLDHRSRPWRHGVRASPARIRIRPRPASATPVPSPSSTRAGRSASSPACRRSATRARATTPSAPPTWPSNGKKVIGLIGGGRHPVDRGRPSADGRCCCSAGCVKIDPWKGKVWPFADFVAVRTREQPRQRRGSTPTRTAWRERHGGFVVADAAGNNVLGVYLQKAISTLAAFPDVMVDAPPFLGLPAGTKIPMQAVPTTVAVRPKDPNVYVGQLTGFPFPPGRAAHKPDGSTDRLRLGLHEHRRHRVGPEGRPLRARDHGQWPPLRRPDRRTLHASGRTASRRSSPARASSRRPRRDRKDGSVYVSNYGTSAGKGTVVNIGKV